MLVITSLWFSSPLIAIAPEAHQNGVEQVLATIMDNSLSAVETDPKLIVENQVVYEMENCESGGNPSATNPMDKDGTPSYGLLQFKPDTLIHYVEKYKIMNTNSWEKVDAINWAYDGALVESIFRKMLYDKDVVWTNEFPACYKQHQELFNRFWNI